MCILPSSSWLILVWSLFCYNDIRMSTPACFLDPFAWKIFFQPFTLRKYLSLMSRCMQQKGRSSLHTDSISLCLFIGELSPLILRDINVQWLLSPWFCFVCLDFYFFAVVDDGAWVSKWVSECVCVCLYFSLVLLVWDYFLYFLVCGYPPCIGVFL